MDLLEKPTNNFIMSCYIIAGSFLILSFAYICFSKNHRMTAPLTAIYALEIISNICASLTFLIEAGRLQDYFWSAAFTTHWLSVAIFTGQYIGVSTQTPLLLEKRSLKYAPLLLNLFVIAVLVLAAYAYIYLHGMAIILVWSVFLVKFFFACLILALQILSVKKTKQMILSIPGLEFNKPVHYETVFIFFIFAINVVLQSLSRVLFTDLKNTINTRGELIFWEALFGSLAVLYLVSYILYINILQTHWSFKHKITYECPILYQEVPLPVYIKNRCLIRDRQVREF